MKEVIVTRQLKREFRMGEVVVHALRGIDLVVEQGDFVAITGARGSGKSTLMNLLGCLDWPTSGDYYLDGHHVTGMSRDKAARIRNERVGFVFPGLNLPTPPSALENLKLPLFYDRSSDIEDPRDVTAHALLRIGLSDRMASKRNQPSSGQQHRVAVAQALVNNPSIILADEPRANLDRRISIDVMALFQELNAQGTSIVVVTHEQDIAQYAKRVTEMRDGLIIRDDRIQHPRNAARDLGALKKESAGTLALREIGVSENVRRTWQARARSG